jgi:hypothetical protein
LHDKGSGRCVFIFPAWSTISWYNVAASIKMYFPFCIKFSFVDLCFVLLQLIWRYIIIRTSMHCLFIIWAFSKTG